ncbi:MAG: branched-chain amino acid ABC transporter permease [Ancalomicrobiaceae bacterium]|nr:branched-chain amino acid ABC transporter permease [Ancalomicrobiaceae bacterium]
MNGQIALMLGQDGMTSGAIYALLALSIILVFSVTRILLVPQGEFVTFSALTMAAMQSGRPVRLGVLVFGLALVALAMDIVAERQRHRRWTVPRTSLALAAHGLFVVGLGLSVPFDHLGLLVQIGFALLTVVPLGPLIYRVFFQPIASAPSLVLLMVAIAVHVALIGGGLLIFGPEGARTEPFSDSVVQLGPAIIASQTLWVIGVSAALTVALWLFFETSLWGKALRAAAFNRLGAELVGISPVFAGRTSMTLAALIGAVSGIVVAPITTIYYDSGFLISLKGFVGAIIGAMSSYPVAALGALMVGQAESFSTFWASSYKEIIVFTLLLPVLLWRSLRQPSVGDDE